MKHIELIFTLVYNRLTRNKIFMRFFISYILILFIPLMVLPVIFEFSYNTIEKKEEDMRSLLNNDCCTNMDAAIRKIDNMVMSLEKSTSLYKILYMKEQPGDGSKNILSLYKARTEMNALVSYADFDYNFALYINGPDLVYDGNSIIYGQEDYYNQRVSYTGMTYGEFKKQVLDQYHNRDVIGNTEMVNKKEYVKEYNFKKKKGILYMVSLPYLDNFKQDNLATLVVLISDSILNALDYIPVGDYGCAFIENGNQNIIYGTYGDKFTYPEEDLTFLNSKGSYYKNLNGQLSLITYTKSSYNGWCYVSISPIDEIMGSISYIKHLFYGIMVIVFITGLLLCIIFSRRNSLPLEDVLYALQEKDGSEIASFSALGGEIHHMITHNEEMAKAIAEQKIKMVRAFYEKLLNGSFNKEDEIFVNAKYLELDLMADMYAFILLSFGTAESNLEEETFSDKNLVQLFTEHLALPQMQFQTYTHVISFEKLGVLIFFSETDAEKNKAMLQAEFNKRLLQMREKFSEEIRCCCGNLYSNVSDIPLSYNEAVMAMEHIINQSPNCTVNFYEDIDAEPSYYFYPSVIEMKLKSLVNAGNTQGMELLLDYIFTENLTKRKLSKSTLVKMFMDMQTGVIRLLQESKLNIHIHGLFKVNMNNLNIENECTRIREAYHQIIHAIKCKPTDSHLFEEMLRYINTNYNNNLLSVSMIAQNFHMSESYFSQYFKKYVDQTFSKYLETLRINRACELIKHTDATIEEVSEMVGYTSSLSFRRAFKKVIGMPPSSYR
ncbi:MAG: helix-turn-helix domain-containing protein [Anaerocolumna sp.]